MMILYFNGIFKMFFIIYNISTTITPRFSVLKFSIQIMGYIAI